MISPVALLGMAAVAVGAATVAATMAVAAAVIFEVADLKPQIRNHYFVCTLRHQHVDASLGAISIRWIVIPTHATKVL